MNNDFEKMTKEEKDKSLCDLVKVFNVKNK